MSTKIPAKVKNEVGSGVSELYQKFKCDYCLENIDGLRIKCADCIDFDLCLECFACGAQIGKHRKNHKYIFMNNGDFSVFGNTSVSCQNVESSSSAASVCSSVSASDQCQGQQSRAVITDVWNARDEMRLLDAIEHCGYGNWKDIAAHIETKTPEMVKMEYKNQYIHGTIGKVTWDEKLRGKTIDHTKTRLSSRNQEEDISEEDGPLSPTLTSKLPQNNITKQEATLLTYMPRRDDFEDFDRENEMIVAELNDRTLVTEDKLETALKLVRCDIYERKLRQQVRRKRVARDYQLMAKFYQQNPILEIVTVGGTAKKFATVAGVTPSRISNQMRAMRRCEQSPLSQLFEVFKPLSQFFTCAELHQFLKNLCYEKEMKVRITQLLKYRQNGLKKIDEMLPFEQERWKHELKLKRAEIRKGFESTNGNKNFNTAAALANLPSNRIHSEAAAQVTATFLPSFGDYSLHGILNPHSPVTSKRDSALVGVLNNSSRSRVGTGIRGRPPGKVSAGKKKKSKNIKGDVDSVGSGHFHSPPKGAKNGNVTGNRSTVVRRKKRKLWSRQKLKTGRRLLLQQGGCILTLADSSPPTQDEEEEGGIHDISD